MGFLAEIVVLRADEEDPVRGERGARGVDGREEWMFPIDTLADVGPGEPGAGALEDIGVAAGVFSEGALVFAAEVDDGVDGEEG